MPFKIQNPFKNSNTTRRIPGTQIFDAGGRLEIAEVGIRDLNNRDLIIAVMGPTGSGKSTFISNVTGNYEGVGHSLLSFTQRIRAIRLSLPNAFSVVLVDTPGFNDTNRPDLDILKQISQWLKLSYEEEPLFLSGLLYFHRISDNRMAGSTLKNLQMFQKLCGSDNYSKVTLVTTMWEWVDGDAGSQREDEIRRVYWEKILAGGAKIRRLDNCRESAWSVLEEILSKELQARMIRLQHEVVKLQRALPVTDAGRQLRGHIEALATRQQDLINRIAREMTLTKDPMAIASLREEFLQLRKTREEAIIQMAELKHSRMKLPWF